MTTKWALLIFISARVLLFTGPFCFLHSAQMREHIFCNLDAFLHCALFLWQEPDSFFHLPRKHASLVFGVCFDSKKELKPRKRAHFRELFFSKLGYHTSHEAQCPHMAPKAQSQRKTCTPSLTAARAALSLHHHRRTLTTAQNAQRYSTKNPLVRTSAPQSQATPSRCRRPAPRLAPAAQKCRFRKRVWPIRRLVSFLLHHLTLQTLQQFSLSSTQTKLEEKGKNHLKI